MLFKDVCIEELSYILPESVVTSSEIEEHLAPLYKALKIQQGTLETLTGVRERRLWPVDLKPSHLASKAAEKLLRKAQVSAQDIDLLIYTGVCRDYIEPATAHVIHHNLELTPKCLSFDLSNACVGFLNGMLISANMIEAKQIRNALIVSGENAAPLLENTINQLNTHPSDLAYRSALASLTLGSGAVAMLLSHRSLSQNQHSLTGGLSLVASQYYDLCQGRGDYHNPSMQTNSPRLLEKGVELGVQTWKNFLHEMPFRNEDLSHILTHQVSIAHHERIFKELNIPLHKGRRECQHLGNTGSIAAPLSLALANEEMVLKNKEHIALLGIGSGLNTIMLGIQW